MQRSPAATAALYTLALLVTLVSVFPFVYAITTSLKTGSELFSTSLWPALVSTGLLAFIAAWNEFLFALTFLSNDAQRTVPVAIAMISGRSEFEVPWGNIMAASVIVTLPVVALVLIFQRRIVSGLTAGAVKG